MMSTEMFAAQLKSLTTNTPQAVQYLNHDAIDLADALEQLYNNSVEHVKFLCDKSYEYVAYFTSAAGIVVNLLD
ncbi:hypothetical protein GCM10011383_38820 [Hymenobacter cavernae]|uniref:Histidine kinase n=1 Tax=Hymenobacter cavernae TaxID=2044852 RepID=A0ABQ1UP44_9BACT|nr:hypothetical protein GCM10011383_38820 [Hymenobacter cavernae]